MSTKSVMKNGRLDLQGWELIPRFSEMDDKTERRLERLRKAINAAVVDDAIDTINETVKLVWPALSVVDGVPCLSIIFDPDDSGHDGKATVVFNASFTDLFEFTENWNCGRSDVWMSKADKKTLVDGLRSLANYIEKSDS